MKTKMTQIAAVAFIAILLLVVNAKAESTETSALSNENIETILQLEKWMTNETNSYATLVNTEEFMQEKEPCLELEDWMTNVESLNLNNILIEESEAGLELESWMFSFKKWHRHHINFEPKLTVEPWMLKQ